MRKEDIAGVVLAGGLSRRMGGGDKGLRTLGHRSVLTMSFPACGRRSARWR